MDLGRVCAKGRGMDLNDLLARHFGNDNLMALEPAVVAPYLDVAFEDEADHDAARSCMDPADPVSER